MPQNQTCKLRKRLVKSKGTSLLLSAKSMCPYNPPIFCHSNQCLHHDKAAVCDVIHVTVARPQLKRSEAFVSITGDFSMFTWIPLVSCLPIKPWTISSLNSLLNEESKPSKLLMKKSVKSVLKVRLGECKLSYIRDEQRGMKKITEFTITDHQGTA